MEFPSRRIRQSVFRFKKFVIDQADCGMKVSSDATLFGATIGVDGARQVLDIGTGTGLLALMVAQRAPHCLVIDAVEVSEAAFKTAKKNIQESPFAEKINVYHVPVQNFRTSDAKCYDLIVCNPPFYQKAKIPINNRSRLLAHHAHELGLSFEMLLDQGVRLLAPEGVLWVLLPHEELSAFKSAAGVKGLYLNTQIRVRHDETASPNRVMVSLNRRPQLIKEVLMDRFTAKGEYTPEVKRLLADFMLEF